jgi:uncharacterized protein (TIGR03437 family)
MKNALTLVAVLIAFAPCLKAQTVVNPESLQFETTADSQATPIFPSIVQGVEVTPPSGAGWQYLGAQGEPNFIVVSPSQGATAGAAIIGLNPNIFLYLRPGKYRVTTTFGLLGQTSPTGAGGAFVYLTVDPPPPPAVASVVISIFGANLGTPPVSGQYNDAGLYPTTLGNTTVTIGGTQAPLLFVSTTQINAMVPFDVVGQKSVDLIVTHDDVAAPAFSVPIIDTSPSIFTAAGTGKGQGAIQNTTGPVVAAANSPSNPAPVGSIVAIYATGGGLPSQTLQDGSIILPPGGYPPKAPLSLTIGGQPAQINYAGAAPFEISGLLQINAVIPQGIGSGAQPVVLKIGANDNSAQQVTVVVK